MLGFYKKLIFKGSQIIHAKEQIQNEVTFLKI